MLSKTPLNDYIDKYCTDGISRFHMPGHKGVTVHGLEQRDITEINGADYLYEASGIIAQSENLTSKIFDTKATYYSTEGSTLSIKTMLGIVCKCRKDTSNRPLIISPRNAHKAFINGCCLLDIDIKWVYPEKPSVQLCSSAVGVGDIEKAILDCPYRPNAVYITSPDYLGNISDIKGISKICKKYKIPFIVDNAHGAYLKFIEPSMHPIDMGADMCADSAHKTLPVYTGGSYLHISNNAPDEYAECAKAVMALFASTSPSYLIMGSLDKCCGELYGYLPKRIRECAKKLSVTAETIKQQGWDIRQNEPLKLVVYPENMGYTGDELADILRVHKIECEYSDIQCIVLMCTPYNSDEDFSRLVNALSKTPKRQTVKQQEADIIPHAITKMSIRDAYFSTSEKIPVELASGRICANTALSCQPSVPIVVSGELITNDVVKILKKYGILSIDVI